MPIGTNFDDIGATQVMVLFTNPEIQDCNLLLGVLSIS